ncbi:MAG: hypothetical protein JW913_01620 [Chitinispirillaceae bacterium]|nr:hypothetical protein [Chitinispirillaceae bacterium]
MKPPGASARNLIRSVIITCCTFSLAAASEETKADSSCYLELRKKLPATGTTAATLETADALAGEGLYEEAVEVLQTLSVQEQHDGGISRNSKTFDDVLDIQISVGADFYQLEDVDTGVMTVEEFREYQRLTEAPLSIWRRAKYTINSNQGILDRIALQTYLSNYRSFIEIPVQLHLPENRIRFNIETNAKAGKWFQPDATSPYILEPFSDSGGLYPSDMGGLSLRFLTESSSERKRGWSWSAPVVIDWEHYHHDRTGYESFVEYRITPAVEYRHDGATSFSSRLIGEARYENYYRTISDSLDAFRGLLHLENTVRTDLSLLQVKGMWFHDNYVNASSPNVINRWETTFRVEYGTRNLLSPQFTAKFIHERESYDPTTVSVRYTLPGTELMIRPSLRLNLTDAFYLEPEGMWERRWAERRGVHYIWWAFSSPEATLRGVLSLKNLDLSLTAGFRREDIDPGFEHQDNRNIRFSADGSVSITSHFSFNFFFDYQYRIYTDSRRTQNITASYNAQFKW